MKIVKLSSKNQITIPSEFLASLKLKPLGKILLLRADNMLILKPIGVSIVNETAGSLTKYVDSSKLGVVFSEIIKKTKRITAKKLARK